MNTASHILLATDFSEASQAAAAMARKLARSFDAKLTVLNVHHTPPEPPEAVVAPENLVWSTDMDTWSLDELEKLKKTEFSDIDWLVLATAECGFADRAICDYARKHGVDLVVVGSHSRTGLTHFFRRSVAEKVVKHAPCAVLVVPPAKHVTSSSVQLNAQAEHASTQATAEAH